MRNFLSTAIQHTKYMFMILQTGTWNFVYSRDQPGANPTPALKMPAPPFIKQECLAHISLTSTPSAAISHSPVLPQKKLAIPPSTQKHHLHDACQVTRKGMLPVCSLPSSDLLRTFQPEDGWDAATALLLLKTLGKFNIHRSRGTDFSF